MDVIVSVRPTSTHERDAKEAIEKYKGIFSAEIDCSSFPNLNAAFKFMGGRTIPLLLMDGLIPAEEVNILAPEFKRRKQKYAIVATTQNYELLKAIIPKEFLFEAKYGFHKGFIYYCIKAFLSFSDREIDPRVIKSILVSVLHVVKSNTQIALVPEKIQETRSAKGTLVDVSAVVAFSGDGIQGSITAATTMAVGALFVEKMLSTAPKAVTQNMIQDLMAEMLNQVLGVVRMKLKEFGYDLTPSLYMVVSGKNHSYTSRGLGKYFLLPFSCGEDYFNLAFSYEAYQSSKHLQLQHEERRRDADVYDVRLVNCFTKCCEDVIESNTRIKMTLGTIIKLKSDPYRSSLLFASHGCGQQGSYLLGMDVSSSGARLFCNRMLGIPEDQVDLETLSDCCGELINQVAAVFRKAGESFGYSFRHVFHGDFVRRDGLEYIFRNRGLSALFQYELEGHSLTFFLGLESKFADQLFNVWGLLQERPGFT